MAESRPAPTPTPLPEPAESSPPHQQEANEPILLEHEYRPRKSAPELSSDLRAMRNLANHTAQAAIDQHVRKRWSKAATGKLCVGVVGVVSGATLMTWSQSYQSLAFLGSAAGFLIGTFWCLQAAMLGRHLMVARAARRKAEQAMLSETNRLPGN